MSTFKTILISILCCSSASCAPRTRNDSSVHFMEEYFKTLNHAILAKDLTTLPALLDDNFYLMPCNGAKYGKPMRKEEFLDAILDLPDNTAPLIEIQWSEYCNEKNPSIFCIRFRLMITGFGGRFDVQSSYKHPYWRGGETGRSLGDVKDNDQQNSLIWKADLSGGSNGDRNVSMEFKNAPSAALSTFSQILKIGTSTMDSTDFPGDVDGLRLEISENLIVFSVGVLGFGVGLAAS
ncbi:hypothetical protein L3Y34_014193 [Caenorhabditis briggsae]|uniref:NTF2-like domain-containing protein n=1 Tax=Caenorhabditis briggsae TaxID=6238 RepID=A0AAE9DR44_CAEBR|nr:hypothetical protein L3Y34_014193 [Caenorhabditis briggsae]